MNSSKLKVTTYSSSSSPTFIEEKISTPLEGLISSMEGVENVQSISSKGSSKIIIEIEDDIDLELFRFLLSNVIKSHFNKLPKGTSYPVVSMDSNLTNVTPALSYSVYSERMSTQDEVNDYLNNFLIPELLSITGVEKVNLEGLPESEIVVELSRSKMNQFNISHSLIKSALSILNKDISTVKKNSSGNYDTYIVSLLSDEKMEKIFLKTIENVPIFLGDVALISKQQKDRHSIFRVNGNTNTILNVYAKEGSNSIKVMKNVKNRIGELLLDNPNPPTFFLNIDRTEKLKEEISNILQRILFSFLILCFLISMVYLNKNIILIFLSVLFVSFCINITLYSLFNILINIYSLAGIAISFGLLIDNVLVVNDHFIKYNNLNVFRPILTSTLTTAIALSLIYFLPQNIRSNLISFSSVIIINLASSVVASFIFVPLFHSHFPVSRNKREVPLKRMLRKIIYKIFRIRKSVILISILLFGLPVYFITPEYISQSPYFSKSIKPKLDYALGGVSHLFYKNIYKNAKGLNSKKKKTELFINVKLPLGSTILQLEEIINYFEKYLVNFYPSKIQFFISRVQSGEFGNIKIGLADDVDFASQLLKKISNMGNSIGGAQISIYGVGPGFVNSNGSSSSLFKIFLKGFNNETLHEFSNDFIDIISENPRVNDINANANLDDSQDKLFSFVFEQTENVGSSNLDAIQESFNQFDNSKINIGKTNQDLNVVLKNADSEGNKLWSLQNHTVYVDSLEFNFSNLGSLNYEVASRSINKDNQNYLKAIEWSYNGSKRFGRNYLKTKLEEFEKRLPLGYSIKADNEKIDLIDRQSLQLILFVLFLIFLISAIHFESTFLAFLIILLVPMSYIGIFLIFYLGDFEFDQGGVASFIIVSGITVNSLILILTQYQKYIGNGLAKVDSYVKAINDKIQPIFLTVITSIFGLLPFIIFSEKEPFWYSLSIGMIGGLLFSIVSLVMMIPAFLPKK